MLSFNCLMHILCGKLNSDLFHKIVFIKIKKKNYYTRNTLFSVQNETKCFEAVTVNKTFLDIIQNSESLFSVPAKFCSNMNGA